MAAEPLMSPPANFVNVTNTFAPSAISTVRRLVGAVLRDRAALRELIQLPGAPSVRVTMGSYPLAVPVTLGHRPAALGWASCGRLSSSCE